MNVNTLVTLVSRSIKFHDMSGRKFPTLAHDIRLPQQWGYAGMLDGTRKALAYRFCGDHTAGGEYVLSVPDWLGPKVPLDVRLGAGGGPVLAQLGILQASPDNVEVAFETWFKERWEPTAALHFGKAFLKSTKPLSFERWDDTPVLLERYVARASISFATRTFLWFGAIPNQIGKLDAFANGVFRQVITVNPKTYERAKTGDDYDLFTLMQQARRLEPGVTRSAQRTEIINRASDLIRKVLDEALLTTDLSNGGLTQSEKYLLREPILSRLNAWKLPAEGKFVHQSVASMLQSTIDGANEHSVRAPEITEFLGIRGRGYRQHIYELDGQGFILTDLATEDLGEQFKEIRKKAEEFGKKAKKAIDKAIEAAEASGRALSRLGKAWKLYRKVSKYFPVAYSLGYVQVKYIGSEGGRGGPQEEPWEAFYGFFIAGAKVAKSAGKANAKIELKGTARQWGAEAMRPEDLEGMVQYLEGSGVLAMEDVFGEAVPSKLGGAVAQLSFMGDLQADAGRQGVLNFVLTAPPKAEKGGKGGLGASIKGLWGVAWSLHQDDPGDIVVGSKEDDGAESEFSTYWEEHLGPMAVFFPINGAHFEVPTEAEREYMDEHQLLSPTQALDAFAAAELPMMVNPLSVFKLEGFADAPDEEAPNRELSGARALTVANYIRAVLGDAWTGGQPLTIANPKKPKGGGADPVPRIEVVGKGEISNPANDYNQADRRVDLRLSVTPTELKDGTEKPLLEMEKKEFDMSIPLARETK